MPNNVTVVGSPTQVELGGKRFYRINFSDGSFRHLRSVTTITKGVRLPSFLDDWERQQVEALGVDGYKAALDQKARDGTDLHKLIEEHIGGKDYDIADADVKKMFESYLRWEAKRKPEWLWTEQVVYSLRFGYAGRCDGLAGINGFDTIVDFKSAKRAQDDHKEQGSGYLVATSEMGGFVPQKVLILCLGAENQQGFTETWLDNPHDILVHFMSFQKKNEMVSYHHPLHV